MHQEPETEALLQPRRMIRATAVTVVATAAMPVIFFFVAYMDFRSPEWDSENDSGAVQGFFFLGVASVLAVLSAGLVFPISATILNSRRQFTKAKFILLTMSLHLVLSMSGGLVAAWSLGSMVAGIAVGPILFVISAILVLPYSYLWLRFAH